MANILVIDDSELSLEFTRLMLEEAGHNVVTTTDPDRFMELAGKGSPRPELLVIDSVMPVISGPELIEQLRRHTDAQLAALPILLISALQSQLPALEGVLALGKPFSVEDLQQALRLALDLKG